MSHFVTYDYNDPKVLHPSRPELGQPIIYVQDTHDSNAQILLFILGFCSGIAWWIGAFCVSASSHREKTFKTLNMILTVLSIILIIVLPMAYYFTSMARVSAMKK